MRLIIHGGIHRTGTTTLQRFFSDNRAALLKQGILYPFGASNHQRIAWDIHAGRLSGGELLGQLESAAAEARPKAILLSGEDFSVHKDLRWLKPLRERFEVEAHFYLKRQDLWLMSWYNQHVKWPFDRRKSRMSAEEFLGTIGDYYWIDFHWLARLWTEALGGTGLRLHVTEGSTDVVSDFCGHLGLSIDDALHTPKPENGSLPPQILEFVRQFGIAAFTPPERSRFLNAVRKVCQERQFPKSNVYSPVVRNLILARFAESNRRTAREYFGRPAGELFAEQTVSPEEPYVSPNLPESVELMEHYAAPLVQALITAHRSK